MKTPGSQIVHIVDGSGHCQPALARRWHENGTIDFTVFTVPGAVSAVRGLPLKLVSGDEPRTENTWHYDCPNSD